jgi:hypothetical protein
MGIQKTLLFSGIALSFLILFGLILATSDSESTRPQVHKDGLSLLFGGRSKSELPNAWGIRGESSESIFDSDFMKSKQEIVEDDLSDYVPLPQGEAPINPQTGKPYPDEAMKEFDELRKEMPDNELIPRRLTKEEREFKKQEDEKLAKASQAVFSGNPSKEDVTLYYSRMMKQSQDRVQIIEYVIENQGGEDPEVDKQYKEIKDSIQSQKNQLESEQKEAYKKYKIDG